MLTTGVSSGIGLAVATRLLDNGWSVTGLSRRPAPIEHPHFRWLAADLTDVDAIGTVVADVPSVDAVVHAAGVSRSAVLGELSAATGEEMWRLHVAAPSQLLNTLHGRLADGARIVLIGSRTMTGVPGKSQYAATKAAMLALARSWAAELVARRITVNVVAPGPTETFMLTDPDRSDPPPQLPPMGRFVQPSEIAGTVAFLLGPDAVNITGQAIIVCAGRSLSS